MTQLLHQHCGINKVDAGNVIRLLQGQNILDQNDYLNKENFPTAESLKCAIEKINLDAYENPKGRVQQFLMLLYNATVIKIDEGLDPVIKSVSDAITDQIIRITESQLISPWSGYGVGAITQKLSAKVQEATIRRSDNQELKELEEKAKKTEEELKLNNKSKNEIDKELKTLEKNPNKGKEDEKQIGELRDQAKQWERYEAVVKRIDDLKNQIKNDDELSALKQKDIKTKEEDEQINKLEAQREQRKSYEAQIHSTAKAYAIAYNQCERAYYAGNDQPSVSGSSGKITKEMKKCIDGIRQGAPADMMHMISMAKQNNLDIRITEDEKYTPTSEEKSNSTPVILFIKGEKVDGVDTIGHYKIRNEDGTWKDVPSGNNGINNDCGYAVMAELTGKSVQQLREDMVDFIARNPNNFKKAMVSEAWIRSHHPKEANSLLFVGGKREEQRDVDNYTHNYFAQILGPGFEVTINRKFVRVNGDGEIKVEAFSFDVYSKTGGVTALIAHVNIPECKAQETSKIKQHILDAFCKEMADKISHETKAYVRDYIKRSDIQKKYSQNVEGRDWCAYAWQNLWDTTMYVPAHILDGARKALRLKKISVGVTTDGGTHTGQVHATRDVLGNTVTFTAESVLSQEKKENNESSSKEPEVQKREPVPVARIVPVLTEKRKSIQPKVV